MPKTNPQLPDNLVTLFEWTFEDYKNKESLAYMVPTIGDINKLKAFVAKCYQQGQRDAIKTMFSNFEEKMEEIRQGRED